MHVFFGNGNIVNEYGCLLASVRFACCCNYFTGLATKYSSKKIPVTMRRKSERTPAKKAKVSPEKKIEKVKRTRSRRKKNSTSSDNESADEACPIREVEPVEVEADKKIPPQALPKEENPDDALDQIWRVKALEGSSDIGEIQKLKICLTRPPSTPERAERSPRSRRKHSRATSSSDTPSIEAVDEKKKSKHRSKRAPRNSRDEPEKNDDSHGEEHETETEVQEDIVKQDNEVTQSGTDVAPEIPVSTTNEDKINEVTTKGETSVESEVQNKSDADTTVVSPKAETTAVSPREKSVPKDTETDAKPQSELHTPEKESPVRQRSESVDKSEVLELHPDESKIECSDTEFNKSIGENSEEKVNQETETKVSITSNITTHNEAISNNSEGAEATNECGVLDSENVEKEIEEQRTDSEQNCIGKTTELTHQSREIEHSLPTQPLQEDSVVNGQAAPIVVNRKRRWGARPKLATQKSITISTDVLKDIIPDVKPVEFDEVIEEKKHKRVEVSEKIERPVLPKIIIDNTENVDLHRKEHNKEDKEKDIVKLRDSHLASNRKISIIKDTDSIIARPPSPPRHKQSCILYITNLVRPFTLQQLKNLLQRTGKIAENGFWIDKIKSKCYVRYEKEDQAVETRHALHGVTWPVSNPKTLQVDFSTDEAFDKAKLNEDTDNAQASTIPGTVEDWLREQDMKREQGEADKPWERKTMREWDVGKNEKDKEKERLRHDDRPMDKRRHRSPERSPEPARKFKKKEEEAPAKLLDDLFKKTKTTPCIYWLPLSAETIAIKEEQRRQHMVEYERRLLEQRRPHRRH